MYVVKQAVVGGVKEFKVDTLDDAVSKMKTIDGRSKIETKDVSIVRKYYGDNGFRFSVVCTDFINEFVKYFNENLAEDYKVDTVLYERAGDFVYEETEHNTVQAVAKYIDLSIDDISDINGLLEMIKKDKTEGKYKPNGVYFGYKDKNGEFLPLYCVYKDNNPNCYYTVYGKLTDEVVAVLLSFMEEDVF